MKEISILLFIFIMNSIYANDTINFKLQDFNSFIKETDEKYALTSENICTRFNKKKDYSFFEEIKNEFNIDLEFNLDSITTKKIFKKKYACYESCLKLQMYSYSTKIETAMIKSKLDSLLRIPYQFLEGNPEVLPQYYIQLDNILVLIVDFYCDEIEDIKKDIIDYFPAQDLSASFLIIRRNIKKMRPLCQ